MTKRDIITTLLNKQLPDRFARAVRHPLLAGVTR